MAGLGTKEIVGKVIVSEETGRRFGVVSDVKFISESGELMNIGVGEATKNIAHMNLNEDDDGKVMIPFTAVKSIGDFVIISERDVV